MNYNNICADAGIDPLPIKAYCQDLNPYSQAKPVISSTESIKPNKLTTKSATDPTVEPVTEGLKPTTKTRTEQPTSEHVTNICVSDSDYKVKVDAYCHTLFLGVESSTKCSEVSSLFLSFFPN